MTEKLSVSLTDELSEVVHQAVDSGDYASASEVVREALSDWRTNRLLGRLWDEGLSSGLADQNESIEDIKAEARRHRSDP